MRIPNSLKEALSNRRVVPFVGAGVSKDVKRRADGEPIFPSWKELLERGAETLRRDGKDAAAEKLRQALKSDDYLDAAKTLRENLLGRNWPGFLRTAFDVNHEDIEPTSLALAETIWRLGSPLVMTTNYDRVLEWACPGDWARNLNHWDIENTSGHAQYLAEPTSLRPTIWHLHGRITNVHRLILTPDGYQKLYAEDLKASDYRSTLSTLRQVMTRQSLLFVGFSLDDEHFGVELRGISELFEQQTGPHWILTRAAQQDAMKERLRELRLDQAVEILPFAGYGEPLRELMHALGDCVDGGSVAAPSVASAIVSSLGSAPSRVAAPFGDVGKITDPARFFDREEILKEILGEIDAGRSVSLVGEAQIGKSSLLARICRVGPERLGRPAEDFVELDFQTLRNEDDFFDALSDLLGLPGVPGWKLARALEQAGRRVVLCLDEVEKMTYPGFTEAVREQLRGLADGNGATLTLVVASRSSLAELFPDACGQTSPLANICPEMRLGPFSTKVARRFLVERMEGTGLSFAEGEMERMTEESGGHPGRLQGLALVKWRELAGG